MASSREMAHQRGQAAHGQGSTLSSFHLKVLSPPVSVTNPQSGPKNKCCYGQARTPAVGQLCNRAGSRGTQVRTLLKALSVAVLVTKLS